MSLVVARMSNPALPVVARLGSLADNASEPPVGAPHTFEGPGVWGPPSHFLTLLEAESFLVYPLLSDVHMPSGHPSHILGRYLVF